MRKVLSAGIIFGLSAAAVSSMAATPTTSARTAIQAQYDQRNAAMARKDAAGSAAGFAPDFVGINLQGQKFSLAEHQAGMPLMLALVKQMKRKTVIRQFAVKGPTAEAKTETLMAMTLRDPRTGKLISGANDVITVDIWVKSGNGWLQEQTQEVESRRLR